MATQAEVLRDGTIGRQEALRVAGRFEPLHPLLSLPSRLVGVLSAIIEIPLLAMFHAGEKVALGRCIALEFISDNHARDIG